MTIDAAFTNFPTLTTNRLHLRQLRSTDAEALFALKSDPRVTEPYGREPQQSLDDTYALMQQLQGLYEGRSAFFWVITLRGEERVIGSCTLFQF
ncbi:MAG TPA: GNAT family N-acetyltransferase, partial [Ktedonobacteraceae bacterium]|nr:GNAT family N-acetyltransferase [Ktedonobacteraceae bacterium]